LFHAVVVMGAAIAPSAGCEATGLCPPGTVGEPGSCLIVNELGVPDLVHLPDLTSVLITNDFGPLDFASPDAARDGGPDDGATDGGPTDGGAAD
jgi:hypothetical protein